jgi:hypothetical protein
MKRKTMKTQITLAVALFIIIASLPRLQAQQVVADSHSTFIMLVPQNLIQNGIAVEIDKRLKNPREWLVIAPTLYYRGQPGTYAFSNSSYGDYEELNLKGGRLEVFYRYYLTQGIKRNLYFSAGGGYRYVAREIKSETWVSYQQDGLTYYRTENLPWEQEVHSFSVKGFMGARFISDHNFSLDFYVGTGMKYSMEQKPDNAPRNLDRVFSYGGSGFIFVGGVRMGVGW